VLSLSFINFIKMSSLLPFAMMTLMPAAAVFAATEDLLRIPPLPALDLLGWM
jgi:hypothetical protein